MKPPDENPLLKEILADENLSAMRHTSLEDAIALMRRDRRRRQATTLTALALSLLFGLWIFSARHPEQGVVASSEPKKVAEQPKLETGNPVKTITDEELFALFPDRAAALIGKPGHQEFVLLDSGKSR